MKTRVLYVSHTSEMSGAERSLVTLLGGLPANVTPVVACPPGHLADAVRAMAVPVVEIAEIKASFRMDPRHTPAAVFEIARLAAVIRRIARRHQVHLIHANSVRAGLAAGLVRRLGGPPTIVHVRDCLPNTATANLTRRAIAGLATMVVANSQYTARNFVLRSHQPKPQLRVVYNAVDPSRFGSVVSSRKEARAELGIDESNQVLGLVAQITPWKGQDDAIRILSELKNNWPDACLLLVGEAKFKNGAARYDNRKFRASLEELSRALGVEDRVRFLGERADLWRILPALDLLLVPSWEEPFGVSLIEAMELGVPVVATNVGGPAEVVRSGEDGLLLPPRKPHLWAEAIDELLRQPERRVSMGIHGRLRTGSAFSLDRYVSGVLDCYELLSPMNGHRMMSSAARKAD
jgi:L-malate glycosyltransferase